MAKGFFDFVVLIYWLVVKNVKLNWVEEYDGFILHKIYQDEWCW